MTDNNFNQTVRLEVQTDEPNNLLAVSRNVTDPVDTFITLANPAFATATTNWASGSGWTLTRLTGPTRGQLTRTSSTTAGSLVVGYNQNITAAPGEFYYVQLDITRVSAVPAGAQWQFRGALVAYNASNVRLGVVAGSDTAQNAQMNDGDGTITWTFDTSAVTPAGTSYLRFELYSHNVWSYTGTTLNFTVTNLQVWKSATRSVTGWTATNAVIQGNYYGFFDSFNPSMGGWTLTRTGESNPTVESDKTAVVAGKKIAVAMDVEDFASVIFGDPADTVQLGIRFYNASNVLVSEVLSAAQTAQEVIMVTDPDTEVTFDVSLQVRIGYQDVVPAGATKASVILKPAGNTFNQPVSFQNVVLITGDTDADLEDTSYAGTLPSSQSNRIMNPSGELGVSGWQDYDGNSVLTTRNALPPNSKSFDFRFGGQWNEELPVGKEIIVAQVTGGYEALYSNTTDVTAGQWVGGSVLAKGRGYFPPAGSYIISYVSVGWQFRDSSDAVISTSLSDPVLTQNDYYRFIQAPVMQAPAGTVRARMVIQNSGDPVNFTPSNPGAWCMIKQAQMNVGTTSASVTNQPLDYAEKWKNILGGTHEIGIQTNELDTGVLTASILDPSLDPAVFDELVPGLKLRLMALVDDVWTSRFQGTITNAKTAYEFDRSANALKPRITIEAADAGKDLATTPSPNTVATINGLANNMPSDIRWNINGKTAVGANPTVVATNPNASVLDQVMVTRDTVGGYAWVDRFGVFNAWDAFNLQRTTAWMTDQQRPAATGRHENIVPNPTFKLGTSLWTAAGGALSWDSTNKAAKVTATGGVATYLYVTTDFAVTAGDTIQGQLDVSAPAGKGWQGHFIFYNSAHTELSRLNTDSSGFVGGTVPTNAVSMRLAIDLYNTATSGNPVAGTVLTVNSAVVVVGSEPWNGLYFDGDSEYATWTGAVHASTSIQDYSLYQDYLTNIDIGFNSGEVINIVNLKVPTRNAEGGYDDVPYGPYQDTTSIADWGPKSVDMTIAGGVTPSTVAARVLSQNANPERTVYSIEFIVDDEDSFKKAATMDLYDQVYVALQGKIAKLHRVSGMEHSLSVQIKNKVVKHRWHVKVFFKALDTAAQVTGGAPSSTSAIDPGPVYIMAKIAANISGIPSGSYANITGWTVTESNGISYASGVFTIPKSGIYEVNSRLQFSGAGGNRFGVRLNLNNSGVGPTNLVASGPATSAQIAILKRFTAGDTLRIMTFQDTGVAIILGGDSPGTWSDMSLRWIAE